jgi:predicted DNA-binding protein (UPF0251 family)
MARPVKWRRVGFIPEVTYFKPARVPLRTLEEVALTVEEAEAIRLKDLEGLEQEQCAERMSISRPTYHRVLQSARGKIADVLINGKALRIQGGNFALDSQPFRCVRNSHEWEVPFEEVAAGRRLACPRCQSPGVPAAHPWGYGAGLGWGRRRGRGGGAGR